MEQTPLPPLVSDEQMQADAEILSKESTAPDAETPNWMIADVRRGIRHARDIYEADRLKTREVVQALVDALAKVRSEAFANVIPDGFTPNPSAIEVVHIVDNAMALAKSQLQIEPKP
jgi:hypothetical protein